MMNRSKILTALCALFCFSLVCVSAQDTASPVDGVAVAVDAAQTAPDASAPPPPSSPASTGQDSSPVLASSSVSQAGRASTFDENAPFAIAAPQAQSGGRNVLGTIGVFVRMILVLAFVIACIYGFVWFMKRSVAQGNNSDQFLRVVASITLAPGKYVKIVSLLDEKAYILGVSDNAVNVIAEVENKETISAMNLYADKMAQTSKPKNFEDILNIFMPGGPKGGQLAGKGAALDGSDAADALRKMRSMVGNADGGAEEGTEEGGQDTGVEQ